MRACGYGINVRDQRRGSGCRREQLPGFVRSDYLMSKYLDIMSKYFDIMSKYFDIMSKYSGYLLICTGLLYHSLQLFN